MAHEHWIITPQGQIFAASWGAIDRSGNHPPIVLVHDSLGCVALWREFPSQLSEATGRAVVAYDRLGFGRSDSYPGQIPLGFVEEEADGVFATVCEWLGLSRYVLFGHSVGGGMAVVAAGRHPDRCEALITESAQAFVEDRTLQGIGEAKRAFAQAELLDRLRKYHGDKADWVLAAWTETWLSEGFRTWNLDTHLPRVNCPVLALHGERDEYASNRHPERIVSLTAGNSELEIFPDCGHVPHRERTALVLRAVVDFLSRTSGA
jgi:pimeloyl-ACP methyl ester carboxylesterase